MSTVDYEACFHVLSRYLATNISTEFERICKFMKVLTVKGIRSCFSVIL